MRERNYKWFVCASAMILFGVPIPKLLPFTNVPVKIFDVEATHIFTHFQWRIHKLCKLNRKFMLVVVYFYHSITHTLTLTLPISHLPSHSHTHTRLLFGFFVLSSSLFLIHRTHFGFCVLSEWDKHIYLLWYFIWKFN